MEYNRIYNFSSGPAVMPVSVLEQIRDELLNYGHTGMSVMEMSCLLYTSDAADE